MVCLMFLKHIIVFFFMYGAYTFYSIFNFQKILACLLLACCTAVKISAFFLQNRENQTLYTQHTLNTKQKKETKMDTPRVLHLSTRLE